MSEQETTPGDAAVAGDAADTTDGFAAAIGRTWTDDRPWNFITDLTALGDRMGGSAGERRAADLVADAFEDAGVDDVGLDTFEMNQWTRGWTELELTAPVERPFDAIALPYSPSGDVEAELVDVGYGTPDEIAAEDVDGKIVVASTTTPSGRFIHRMEKYGCAVEAGAEAFVFVNHIEGQLPPTGSLTFGDEGSVPAVGVSKETGAWLKEYAANNSGETGRLRIAVEAETTPGESQNVVGHVGPNTDEELLLLAHYDAHDIAEGALDNGCGIATVVTAARILAQVDLDVGVRVAGVGCEEIGLLGAERVAETTDLSEVKAVVNVDGAGRFRNLVALTHNSDAMSAAAERIDESTRQPINVDDAPHPFSDHWPFVREGVPAFQLHSDSGERGRGWGHTHADTRDKVDDRNIREHAILTALLVDDLATADAPRLDLDDLAATFRENDFEVGMRAADLWPAEWE
ncbi:M28 family peptidase [Haloprofundus sp. MHR1]|uniref:M28 family peptidase n=1 Tax=Haloprofundus sp. MHR1 TaxID=2572921 RepID=UPI0010BF3AD3|nr:M28 family metallopeptidase [Haloprofundus sp. MHR1]QCJ45810.1 M28 family peptidase [Haloprofundus sp. MHR1]